VAAIALLLLPVGRTGSGPTPVSERLSQDVDLRTRISDRNLRI